MCAAAGRCRCDEHRASQRQAAERAERRVMTLTQSAATGARAACSCRLALSSAACRRRVSEDRSGRPLHAAACLEQTEMCAAGQRASRRPSALLGPPSAIAACELRASSVSADVMATLAVHRPASSSAGVRPQQPSAVLLARGRCIGLALPRRSVDEQRPRSAAQRAVISSGARDAGAGSPAHTSTTAAQRRCCSSLCSAAAVSSAAAAAVPPMMALHGLAAELCADAACRCGHGAGAAEGGEILRANSAAAAAHARRARGAAPPNLRARAGCLCRAGSCMLCGWC